MEMKEFAEKVRCKTEQLLGEEYKVTLQEVQKNNGVRLQGLLIMAKRNNVSPTIYLDHFLEAYESGVPLAELVDRILQIYREDTMQKSIDLSFFRDFEKVKRRICYRVINSAQNEALLKQIPHVPLLDLAICFYYALEDNAIGNGSILIYNSHMEMWHTCTAELMWAAQDNTPRIYPPECISMGTMLAEVLKEEEKKEAWITADIPMKVISNPNRLHGAACMLYPGLLKKVAELFKADFYVIPSSVHELIILPADSVEHPEELRELIGEVNRIHVEPEEVLSDNLYYYSRHDENIKII